MRLEHLINPDYLSMDDQAQEELILKNRKDRRYVPPKPPPKKKVRGKVTSGKRRKSTKEKAMDKLKKLGLTNEEIKALMEEQKR